MILKRFFGWAILMLSLVVLFSEYSYSKNGDTTTIRTIEFTTPRDGWFEFPAPDKKFQRIIANYKLICPPGKPCGEWDYIAYIFVTHFYAPSYRFNNKSPETSKFVLDTAYTYKAEKINEQWTITKTPKPEVTIYFYNINDDKNPTKPVDSMTAWELFYTDYKMDSNGKFIDSTLSTADTTFNLEKKRVYFNDNVTIKTEHEISRYITPYGNNLSLGAGWTFKFDLTDFQELLSGKVFLYAPCGGWGDQRSQTNMESLELTFDFIEGTPVRDIKSLTKLWQINSVVYNKDMDSKIPEKEFSLIGDEKTARLKIIHTGHGFGGNDDNCAEFCKRKAYVMVNKDTLSEKYIWRECGDVPLFPQGGTWLLDRTNWCPGFEVEYHDYELTSKLNSGNNFIDYGMDFYNKSYTSNGTPNWVITGWLIKYGDFNFQTDASMIDIITPSNDSLHKRFNPASFNSVIKFRNTGKNEINSVKFEYGFVGMNKQTYTWNGTLPSLADTVITLPFDDYVLLEKDTEFNIFIKEVNGKVDEYAENNFGKSIAKMPRQYLNGIIANLVTNNYNDLNAASPYQVYVVNSKNEVVFKRESTDNNKTYLDTINLPNGAYTYILSNAYGYGLGYWVLKNNYGLKNGSLALYSGSKLMQNFNPDFGNAINYSFVVADLPIVKANVVDNKHDFGDIPIDSVVYFNLELETGNSRTATIKSILMKDGDNKKFELLEITPLPINNQWVLNPGEKITVRIKYTALLKGKRFCNLEIVSNDFYFPTRQIRIEARGVDPVSVDEHDIQTNIKTDAHYLNANMIIENSKNIPQHFEIELYNSLGQKVQDLYSGIIENSYQLNFDISNLESGIYFVNSKVGNFKLTNSFIIVR